MIDKKLDFGVGVLFLCPKCKSILKSNQKNVNVDVVLDGNKSTLLWQKGEIWI